jgi:hypothetical protein
MKKMMRFEELQNGSNFFESLLEWDPTKTIFVTWHALLTIIGPALFVAIIWYEKYSANLHYRTLINQLLSHFCRLHLFGCLVVRLPYVYFLSFGNFSDLGCEITVYLGLVFYISMVTQICIRQVIKYLYIFKWRYVIGLNDDFFATFLTLANILLSSLLAFVDLFLGHLQR